MMNVRAHLTKIMQDKYGIYIDPVDADVSVIRDYFAPVEPLLGQDYDTFCQALFTVYRTQFAIYKRNTIDVLMEMVRHTTIPGLSDRYVGMSAEEAKSAAERDEKDPEFVARAKKMREEAKENPKYMMGIRGILSQQLYIACLDNQEAEFPDKRVPLEVSDFVSKLVEDRDLAVGDWKALGALSFERYCDSYKVHSDLEQVKAFFAKPKVKEAYNKELAKESSHNLYAMCGDFETFLSDFLKESVALEERGKKEMAPILEKGYASYQQCMQILVERAAKADVTSLPKVDQPFAHLPKSEDLSDESFAQAVIEASKSKPVLVKFTAPWCPPCKALQPVLDEIDTQIPALKILKADSAQNEKAMSDLGVKGLPTLVLYWQGKPAAERLVGLKNKDEIMEYLQASVKASAEGQQSGSQAARRCKSSIVSMFSNPVAPIVVGAAAIGLAYAAYGMS